MDLSTRLNWPFDVFEDPEDDGFYPEGIYGHPVMDSLMDTAEECFENDGCVKIDEENFLIVEDPGYGNITYYHGDYLPTIYLN